MSVSIDQLLSQIVDDLRQCGTRFAMIGGFAVAVRAEPRFTRDFDFAVAVDDDVEAEALLKKLVGRGYVVEMLVEQTAVGRLSTARLVPPGQTASGVILDLLFASSGIENEICLDAQDLEILTGVVAPVATRAALIALKVLARDDASRPQDHGDLVMLMKNATSEELIQTRTLLSLIQTRGFQRGRDLLQLLAELS